MVLPEEWVLADERSVADHAVAMNRAELEFELPPRLIAQQPVEPRDASRLLVLDRAARRLAHRQFRDLLEYLRAGDLLVVNDTRVLPARFHLVRASGGRIEALFLHEMAGEWNVLLGPSARLKVGERLSLRTAFPATTMNAEIEFELLQALAHGEWRVRPAPGVPAAEFLAAFGEVPLPPYIERPGGASAADVTRYQTIFAQHGGAVAAPTAGLHFTDDLLRRAAEIGVRRAAVTLHVGPGTFRPVEADDLRDHRIHSEWFELTNQAAAAIQQTRAAGGRIIAVGTTSARVLESVADGLRASSGWTDIFIYPPYRFRHVDALVTNFHLPGSTLIALVMAFASPELIRMAYRDAIREEYRFYSYGDAMLIT